MKAYCKVDFLFPVKDRLFIMDWKTGKPDSKKHRKQMVGYAAWAAYHFEKDPILKSLPSSPTCTRITKKPYHRQGHRIWRRSQGRSRKETAHMQKFCQDVQKNIPKDKRLFLPTKSKLCRYCNFKALCP
jgi:hypothetical protein